MYQYEIILTNNCCVIYNYMINYNYNCNLPSTISKVKTNDIFNIPYIYMCVLRIKNGPFRPFTRYLFMNKHDKIKLSTTAGTKICPHGPIKIIVIFFCTDN